MRKVTLDCFVDAFSGVMGESFSPDSWIWADAGLDADEWGWVSIELVRKLEAKMICEAPVSHYLPGGVGYWWRSRTVPDIRLREVYAYCEFTE